MVQIVPWAAEWAPAFETLNREWLERDFSVEPLDEALFADPVGRILEPGGAIWFALEEGRAVGTVAAIRGGPLVFEMAKMAVAPAAQGRGVGRALAEAVIAHATAAGADRVRLLTDTKLAAAVRLYERLGFRRVAGAGVTGYARGDVQMELALPPGERGTSVPRGVNKAA
ncbi:GNAT family N-acetyltransferase [Alienimonas californiensis]|uniref:Putative acetyltransferase n=1 Tax=Alienimonas californiensis TaxID=2527989 RepID=A0A517PCJ7_9PLAN|nr:GNAT family N-acetyltransferase [Alienimonas californiensis]QDT17095.1 putative acetyltransferase [Alienimonas californiensis]